MTSFMPLTSFEQMKAIHHRHGIRSIHKGNAMTTKTVLSLLTK
jgi:hypothetical protein